MKKIRETEGDDREGGQGQAVGVGGRTANGSDATTTPRKGAEVRCPQFANQQAGAGKK